ncbi:hypothetical protein [Streptomyces sp. NPDC001500]
MRAHWYFQWFTVLFLGATVAVGAACRTWRRRSTAPAGGVPETAAA